MYAFIVQKHAKTLDTLRVVWNISYKDRYVPWILKANSWKTTFVNFSGLFTFFDINCEKSQIFQKTLRVFIDFFRLHSRDF
jgi:hypothetical protein